MLFANTGRLVGHLAVAAVSAADETPGSDLGIIRGIIHVSGPLFSQPPPYLGLEYDFYSLASRARRLASEVGQRQVR